MGKLFLDQKIKEGWVLRTKGSKIFVSFVNDGGNWRRGMDCGK
jgi:hypothetical protein